MSSQNDVSYVHNGLFKFGMNSSLNMNILIPMHIMQVKENAPKISFVIICCADIVVSAISYYYKTQNNYRSFHKNQNRAFNKSQNNKRSFDCPSVFIGYIVSLM